ncbi:fibroblast growth factor receptor-like 1 [Octopus vulgaris]|uniref:Fibroblast growth factor receptor-like 1 n=1 Tax=Octopus vulgaris TaxID=6645 RepID=A0AA36FFU7_OCTVU|nr:fibroblast growth factor receptor-like 1 [Octopus vulgaris]
MLRAEKKEGTQQNNLYPHQLDPTGAKKVQEKPQLLPPHPLNQTARRGEQASFQCHVKNPKHSRPNQKITPSTSKIPFLGIWIPAIMLAIIAGAIALVYSNRCHGRCSQTSHNSNHEHVQHLAVPTSHHEDPVNYPQMLAYHTPNIHAGSSTEKKEGTQQNNLYPHQLDPTGATEPRFLHLRKMKKKAIPRPAGSSIWFRCRASGNPRPEIQWLKDGQMWTSDNMGNYQDSRPRWTLKIDDLRQEDSEKVHEKPQLLPPHPLNQTARRGEQASFQCHVKNPNHSPPNQKITLSTSKILFVDIWIPAIMLAIITGAIALVYSNRCHGRCSQTSHNSNHEHVQLEHVPTSHHEDPVNYPQMSAYHTPNIHAGSSSMSSSSSFSIASSSIPPLRY